MTSSGVSDYIPQKLWDVIIQPHSLTLCRFKTQRFEKWPYYASTEYQSSSEISCYVIKQFPHKQYDYWYYPKILSTFFTSIQFKLAQGFRMLEEWVNVQAISRWSLRSNRRAIKYRIRSHKDSKPRDPGLYFSNHSESWQAHRQQCCRDAGQISERYDQYNIQSRGFEISRALAVRRLAS